MSSELSFVREVLGTQSGGRTRLDVTYRDSISNLQIANSEFQPKPQTGIMPVMWAQGPSLNSAPSQK